MDPIADGENYEVTIHVEGPLNVADFKTFRKKLTDFLAEFPGDGTPAPPKIMNSHKKYDPPGTTRPSLQVREGRGGQRKNA
jgi:hypothetical protein